MRADRDRDYLDPDVRPANQSQRSDASANVDTDEPTNDDPSGGTSRTTIVM